MFHVNVDICSRRILEHTCTIVCVVGEVKSIINIMYMYIPCSTVRWEKEVG